MARGRPQECKQPESEPPDEKAEVVSGCGEDGVSGAMRKVVSLLAVLGLEMSNDGLDSASALDLGSDTAFLT